MKRRKGKSLGLAIAIAAGSMVISSAASAQCASTQKRYGEIMNYEWTTDVIILAHRGFWGGFNPHGIQTPENSIKAMIQADEHCMDGIEIDVKMSGDNLPYVMHDYNVGRTTNYSLAIREKNRLYNPYFDGTNSEFNPKVDSVRSYELDRLSLLIPNRSTIDGASKLPSVGRLLNAWNDYHLNVPIIFDVKTSDAVRALNTLIKAKIGNGKYKMGVKVNATLYQSQSAFFRDAPDIYAIPVFTTNMLGQINVDQVMSNWFNAFTLEVNLKQPYGLMYTNKDRVLGARKRLGVFHAYPDENSSNGTFFKNTGECCYKLSDVYYTWKPGFRDTQDRRGDLQFLFDQGFNLITTDNPNGVASFFAARGKRRGHPSRF